MSTVHKEVRPGPFGVPAQALDDPGTAFIARGALPARLAPAVPALPSTDAALLPRRRCVSGWTGWADQAHKKANRRRAASPTPTEETAMNNAKRDQQS